jgi:RNA polymerase sigma factor (sigma-70 family)
LTLAAVTRETPARARLSSVLVEFRADLHRYCARLTGSIFDGEDIVQDVITRALEVAEQLDETTPLKPWLLRMAHNRSVDHIRRQARRRGPSLEAVLDVPDEKTPDPSETLLHKEAITAALSTFLSLPIRQRSTVILKDVLGHSLEEIAVLLGITPNAVKAALSRGRTRLHEFSAAVRRAPLQSVSPELRHFIALFNDRDWDRLRALLADDVRLTQATHADRHGREQVGVFFSGYAATPQFHLAAAFADEGEVVAVFDKADDEEPAYLMKIDWRGTQIAHIRDFRYGRYVMDSANLRLAPLEGALLAPNSVSEESTNNRPDQ